MPILRVAEGLADRTALATWHEALSDGLAVDVPHDLLGLWLYPAKGPPVLLGPEALAQDSLAVPTPSPQLQPHHLASLESVIRGAGYGSVVCLPVRFGRRDVGLMLVADLRPDRYGENETLTLRLVAQRIAPVLGRLARQWSSVSGEAMPQVERIAALLDVIAHTNAAVTTPQCFLAALSPALEPILPHDHLELLLADPAGARHYRLGEHAGGALWHDPSLIIGREDLDVESLFGSHGTLLLADACRDSRWPRGYFTVSEPAGAEPRGVVGARVSGPGGVKAFLLAASVGAELYGEADVSLLERLAALIGPQVSLLVASASGAERESRVPSVLVAGMAGQAASMLATSTDVPEAMRRTRGLAAGFLPFDEMRYAIRLRQGDRIVLLEPGERRPLSDLPPVAVAGTALGQVLAAELPNSFALMAEEAQLVVPLRVGGRVNGALVFTGRHPAMLNEDHLAPAQELADVVAPHLELLRRSALLPPPYRPGWKRTQKS